ALRQLPLRLDCEPVYTRTGWLFLVDVHDAEFAAANVDMQEGEGLESVDVDDLQEVLPGVDESGIAYAVYEPESGYADPLATTLPYVEAGRRAGGVARDHARVDAVELAGDRVRGVRVGSELLECDALVL